MDFNVTNTYISLKVEISVFSKEALQHLKFEFHKKMSVYPIHYVANENISHFHHRQQRKNAMLIIIIKMMTSEHKLFWLFAFGSCLLTRLHYTRALRIFLHHKCHRAIVQDSIIFLMTLDTIGGASNYIQYERASYFFFYSILINELML